MKTHIIEEDIGRIVSEFESDLASLKGKTLFITGANGFIPSYLVDTIQRFNEGLSNPCHMILLNRNIVTETSRLSHILSDQNIQFITQDVGQPFQVPGRPNIIIHAASRANPTFFLKDPIDTIDANVNGARTLLEHCAHKPVENFLYFSSAEVYGNPPPELIPTPETYPGNVNCLNPKACYSESKRLAETLCLSFFRQYNVPVKIARIFHTYGPGIRDDGKAITDFFNQAHREKRVHLRDMGESEIAFAYVADTVRGLFYLMFRGKNGEAYNIGDDREVVSMKSLAGKINSTMGNTSEIETTQQAYLEGYQISRRCPDLKKIRALGFKPQVTLDEGLARLAEDFHERC